MSADLISRTAAAAMVGVSSDTLARWNAKPACDFPRPVAWTNRHRFYSKSEILDWLEARTKTRKRRPARKPTVQSEARA